MKNKVSKIFKFENILNFLICLGVANLFADFIIFSGGYINSVDLFIRIFCVLGISLSAWVSLTMPKFRIFSVILVNLFGIMAVILSMVTVHS